MKTTTTQCFISFIITSWNKTQDDITDLKKAIEKHYPNLKYEVIILNDPHGKEYYLKHMIYMRYKEDDYEIARNILQGNNLLM